MDKQKFIEKTFMHVFGASVLFILFEVLFFNTFIIDSILNIVNHINWLLFLGGASLIAWGATHLASNTHDKGLQYSGLILYVLSESILFAPLLVLAYNEGGAEILIQAGTITILGFALLSGMVIKSGKDFSFLNIFLTYASILALIFISVSCLTGFTLGLGFSVAMLIFSAFAILKDTSDIIHKYEEDQYVIASLNLFASVMLMLWYVIRILLKIRK